MQCLRFNDKLRGRKRWKPYNLLGVQKNVVERKEEKLGDREGQVKKRGGGEEKGSHRLLGKRDNPSLVTVVV